MSKAYFALATVFTVLVLGSATAFAQQFPVSAAPQQATLAKDPAACGNAVDRAADNVSLRLHQNSPGGDTRQLVIAFLLTARDAASTGDERTCWYWYDRTQNLAR
ncbi:MAG TPA: hypothetical protein VGB82_14575 [Alphaproteobacteria bacterium]